MKGSHPPKGPAPIMRPNIAYWEAGTRAQRGTRWGPVEGVRAYIRPCTGAAQRAKWKLNISISGGGIPLTLGSRPKDNMEIKHFHLGEGFPRPRNVDGKSQSTKYEPRGPINKFSSVSPFQGNGGGVYHLYFVPLSLLLIVCAPHTRAPTHRNPHPSHTWTNCPRVTVTPRRMFLGPRRGPVSSHRP